MKVLIVAVPRSGSTSLMYSISKDRNLKHIFEPFNRTHNKKFDYKSNLDNVVIKTLIGQTPDYDSVINDEVFEKWEKWMCNFVKEFDEVILLSRRDKKAASESHSVASWNNYSWFNKYQYKILPNLEKSIDFINKCNKYLEILSNKINIDITHYEDIFDLKSNNRLRIDIIEDKKLH